LGDKNSPKKRDNANQYITDLAGGDQEVEKEVKAQMKQERELEKFNSKSPSKKSKDPNDHINEL